MNSDQNIEMSKCLNVKRGFTLIEILVVAAITGVISTFMLLAFQRTRVDLNESGSVFIADLRAAQSKALASTKYDSGSG